MTLYERFDMGRGENVFKMLGASNHTVMERQPLDYYATDPLAAELLLGEETFDKNVWECACGGKHLSGVLERHGYNVRSSDIMDRCGNEVYDFLGLDNCSWTGDIITNPPYRLAVDFVYKALRVIPDGNKVAMFLRLQFLEGKSRKDLFARFPPKVIYVSSSRILCAKNGDFARMQAAGGSAVAYAWFVWVKGLRQPTIVKWIN